MKYEWSEFEEEAKFLHGVIADYKQYDAIVGITRGGVFLAGMLAELSGKKELYTIGLNSYKGHMKTKLMKLTQELHQDLVDKKILLCDDISDSGDTLIEAKRLLEAYGNTVTTCCLHFNKDTKLKPDYFASEAIGWVYYPWDFNN